MGQTIEISLLKFFLSIISFKHHHQHRKDIKCGFFTVKMVALDLHMNSPYFSLQSWLGCLEESWSQVVKRFLENSAAIIVIWCQNICRLFFI